MKISTLAKPNPEPAPVSVMLVNYSRCEATPTQWIAELEKDVLARAESITQVTNAEEQEQAVAAQAGLAMYVRRVQTAEEKAKRPLNDLRKKILDLSKALTANADEAGNRIGALVADFQTAEKIRVAAARRVQDLVASALEQERDQRLSEAQSVNEQDQIRGEFNELIAAEAKPVETARTDGQVIKEDWEITVNNIFDLFRAHPGCCKITPLVSEIKTLLNMGVKVHGVNAKKITTASVRLVKEREAISI